MLRPRRPGGPHSMTSLQAVGVSARQSSKTNTGGRATSAPERMDGRCCESYGLCVEYMKYSAHGWRYAPHHRRTVLQCSSK